jgi:hypothetical protein
MSPTNSQLYVGISARFVQKQQYTTPNTGDTITVESTGYILLIIDPSGTLATLTVSLPPAPVDGDRIQICSTQVITALTVDGGTIVGAPASLGVGGNVTFFYNNDSVKWITIS